MKRLVIILSMFLIAAVTTGADSGQAVPVPQRMITSDTFLGIRTRVDARSQHLEVTAVAPESPAARADILPGDVILRVNGHRVQSREALFLRMRHFNAGEQLPLQLLRAGECISLSVTLSARPAPAVIGRVHAVSHRPVALGNIVTRQIELATELSRPGTTLEDVQELLRSICRDCGGRAARTGNIRLIYTDKAGVIRLQHRPGRLEIITSGGGDRYSAALLTQPWHTLPPAFQQRFRNVSRKPTVTAGEPRVPSR